MPRPKREEAREREGRGEEMVGFEWGLGQD